MITLVIIFILLITTTIFVFLYLSKKEKDCPIVVQNTSPIDDTKNKQDSEKLKDKQTVFNNLIKIKEAFSEPTTRTVPPPPPPPPPPVPAAPAPIITIDERNILKNKWEIDYIYEHDAHTVENGHLIDLKKNIITYYTRGILYKRSCYLGKYNNTSDILVNSVKCLNNKSEKVDCKDATIEDKCTFEDNYQIINEDDNKYIWMEKVNLNLEDNKSLKHYINNIKTKNSKSYILYLRENYKKDNSKQDNTNKDNYNNSNNQFSNIISKEENCIANKVRNKKSVNINDVMNECNFKPNIEKKELTECIINFMKKNKDYLSKLGDSPMSEEKIREMETECKFSSDEIRKKMMSSDPNGVSYDYLRIGNTTTKEILLIKNLIDLDKDSTKYSKIQLSKDKFTELSKTSNVEKNSLSGLRYTINKMSNMKMKNKNELNLMLNKELPNKILSDDQSDLAIIKKALIYIFLESLNQKNSELMIGDLSQYVLLKAHQYKFIGENKDDFNKSSLMNPFSYFSSTNKIHEYMKILNKINKYLSSSSDIQRTLFEILIKDNLLNYVEIMWPISKFMQNIHKYLTSIKQEQNIELPNFLVMFKLGFLTNDDISLISQIIFEILEIDFTFKIGDILQSDVFILYFLKTLSDFIVSSQLLSLYDDDIKLRFLRLSKIKFDKKPSFDIFNIIKLVAGEKIMPILLKYIKKLTLVKELNLEKPITKFLTQIIKNLDKDDLVNVDKTKYYK